MAVVLVQSTAEASGGTATPAMLYGSANAAGNLLVLAFTIYNDTTTITSVTDTRGNTWNLAVASDANGLGERAYIYYAENCAAGANTVTVNLSAASGGRLEGFEFSGLLTAASIGPVNKGTGSGSVPSVGLAGTVANSLLFGMGVSTSDIAPDTGYTSGFNGNSNFSEESIYALDSGASGAKTVLWTGSGTWTACAASFKTTAGSGTNVAVKASGLFSRRRN